MNKPWWMRKAVPSKVYCTYWELAYERQEIFYRRLQGEEPPWTKDPILARYKFTNAYRASDRVSQYLISQVIYTAPPDGTSEWSAEETFFRIILFKMFNKIETWQALCGYYGQPTWRRYDFKTYVAILDALNETQAIFNSAYLRGPTKPNYPKHHEYLHILESMMKDEAAQWVRSAHKLQRVYEYLRSFKGVGPFLAYQWTIDLNYSTLVNFSENDFVIAGLGARAGIAKCFRSIGEWRETDIIRMMCEHQHDEFARLGLAFRNLGGRDLTLIDCQNLFCETDKYARVAFPELVDKRNKRTHIKKPYSPAKAGPRIEYFYPPKWGIVGVHGVQGRE